MSSTPNNPIPRDADLHRWLLDLTDRQRLALRLNLVDKLTQKEIGSRMGITQPQISDHIKTAIANLERKTTLRPLPLERVREAYLTLPLTPGEREVLAKVILNSDLTPEEQDAESQAAVKEVETPQPTQSVDPLAGLGNIRREVVRDTVGTRPSVRINWMMIGLAVGLLMLGLILGSLLNRSDPQAATIQSPTPGSTQTARVEAVVETLVVVKVVTQTVEQTVIVTQPPIVVTATAPPTPQVTLPPSQTPTPRPTEPPTDTPTPKPSPTLSLLLPFKDTFDTPSLRPEWTLISGLPVISKGKVSSVGSMSLQIGDKTLSDYVLEFQTNSNGFHIYFGPFIRYREYFDNDRASPRFFCIYELGEGQQWSLVAQPDTCIFREGGNLKFTITGSTFTLTKDNLELSSMSFPTSLVRGPIRIDLSPRVELDNVTLSLPE